MKNSFSDKIMDIFMDNFTFWMVVIIIAFILFGVCLKWFSSEVQKDVYKRQGVEMTTFEVFCGAKPVMRYMVEEKHSKESKE